MNVVDVEAGPAELVRPRLHIHPEHGWLNDPNGLCRIDGVYHVFFQYNPVEPVHGNVHWGHVSSTDLLHWTTEPIALRPQPDGPDRGGCWSGCIVDDGGVPTAVYTGVLGPAWESGVMLARSHDRTLRAWTQENRWQVSIPEDPAILEVRDPFLFSHDGHRYAVQGAGHRHGSPQLLVYGCDDLDAWELLGPLLTVDDPVAAEVAPAQLWECPNLFPLGDRWVLLVSLWRWVNDAHDLAGVRYLVGDLVPHDGGGLRFVAESGGDVDAGPTFYAPQVLLEEDRVLLWGWAWEGPQRSAAEIVQAGWCGTLTTPRELTLDGGVLVSAPAEEWRGLRREPVPPAADGAVDLVAFEAEAPAGFRLSLVDGSGAAELVAESSEPSRVLVDGSLIEVFGAGASRTTRAYRDQARTWRLESPGAVEVWRLGLDD